MSLLVPLNPLGIYKIRKKVSKNISIDGLNNYIIFNENNLTINGLSGETSVETSQPNYNLTLNNLNNNITINSEMTISGLNGDIII